MNSPEDRPTQIRIAAWTLLAFCLVASAFSLLNPIGVTPEVDEGHYIGWGLTENPLQTHWFLMKAMPVFLIREMMKVLPQGAASYLAMRIVFTVPVFILASGIFVWRLRRGDGPAKALFLSTVMVTVPSCIQLNGRLLSDLWALGFTSWVVVAIGELPQRIARDTLSKVAAWSFIAFTFLCLAYFSRTLSFISGGVLVFVQWIAPLWDDRASSFRSRLWSRLFDPRLVLGIFWGASVLLWNQVSIVAPLPFAMAMQHVESYATGRAGGASAFTLAFGVLAPAAVVLAICNLVLRRDTAGLWRYVTPLVWVGMTMAPYFVSFLKSPASVMPRYAMEGSIPLVGLLAIVLSDNRARDFAWWRIFAAIAATAGLVAGCIELRDRIAAWSAHYTHGVVQLAEKGWWLAAVGATTLVLVAFCLFVDRLRPHTFLQRMGVASVAGFWLLVLNTVLPLKLFAVNCVTLAPDECARLFRMSHIPRDSTITAVGPAYEGYLLVFWFPEFEFNIVDPTENMALKSEPPYQEADYIVLSPLIARLYPGMVAQAAAMNGTRSATRKVGTSWYLETYSLEAPTATPAP